MVINIIVARARDNVIGKGNAVPWRLKNDFIRLKSLIKDKTVILGRKTYDSLIEYYDKSGRPMPAKMYIIVTRQPHYQPARDNAKTATSLKEAIKAAKSTSHEVFVIGGAQIYDQVLPFADRLYITEVDAEVDGDAFFPAINPEEWIEATREKHYKDEEHNHRYDYVMLDRIKK